MAGGCDARYGIFHADLALYFLVTRDMYCQLYRDDPALDNLVLTDGTLL